MLIADPFEPTRQLFARFLERLNFDIRVATNAAEVTAILQAARPDLVLCDVDVPVAAVADALCLHYVPTIITAATDSAAGVPLWAAGMLVKPSPLATMLKEIRRALRSSSLPIEPSTT